MTEYLDDRSRAALQPTDESIGQQPLKSNAEAAADVLRGNAGAVLDIGCGGGKFTLSLTNIYDRVAGVDVREKVINRAKAAAEAAGKKLDFRLADGQALPFADGEFDTVVISNSLHHIPDPRLGLKEALRVLKPGGTLYVMEPVASGHYFEATKLVNDETDVRREAYGALLERVGKGVSEVSETMYRQRRIFADFEEWKSDQIDRDEKRRAKFDAAPDKVRDTFMGHAENENGKLAFDQVFRVNLLKKAG